ncbi:hypothetical protein F8388_018813 [Cannabis sativa]|uniref:RNase H type-1 domain-containing protein n=1 Tax=Cannabis sativa TaxID=3483 RepID=A0A7J6FGC6_CANSA|nr:hypothetical protein F8388_018813 [Cannabis sativa]KAF4403603.1 hypothetical protein G4B88_002456 [Cannabis sativa]
MADPSLNELFEDSVQVSVNDITLDLHPGEVDPPNEPCKIILGKLFCHTRLGKKAIQGSLKNAWASISGWSWKERDDGLLQFSFRTSFDAENVLLRRPWLVCGYLLVLMPWPSWLTPEEVSFDHTPIWVRLKSIPPFYWNKTNLQELAGKVSSVYELPRFIEKNFERGSFGMGTLRFRATIDLSKPLFSGFFLRRPGIKDLWLQYQYEKLPKICYKCGLMTHEQKFCFKKPTVIKDDKGSFFPMFGNWMAEEAREKSPFHPPIPNWFNEWIVNQQAAKDEKVRHLLQNQKISLQIEANDMRELRNQYPGKRRQVETVVETRVDAGEVVLNRFPAIHLPGIGEVTPFENTANLVVEKILPEFPSLELKETMQHKDVPTCSSPEAMPANNGSMRSGSTSQFATKDKGLLVEDTTNEAKIDESTKLAVGEQITTVDESICHGPKKMEAQNIAGPSGKSPRMTIKKTNATKGPDQQNLLGTQAHLIDWPSKECWEIAFDQLLGAKTIDKYHREPTLFNPILDIEEIRCYEAEHGPRKRKSTDGFLMLPEKREYEAFSPNKHDDSHNCEGKGDLPITEIEGDFSPGSYEIKQSHRKRGRPRKCTSPVQKPQEPTTTRKRGRPVKDPSPLAARTIRLKREGSNRKQKKVGKHYSDPWNTASVELAIDLHNHFVVIEKNTNAPRGFGLYWRNGIKCVVQSGDKNLISVIIESDPPGTPWNLLGIYGPPNFSGKEAFWNGLGDLLLNTTHPYVLIGDLNGTLADHENLNYSNWRNAARYSFDLRRMVARTGVVDLGSHGGKFTWFQKSNSTGGTCCLKRARLDRALASIDWRMLHPNAITQVLSSATSDHRPILLDMDGGVNCRRTQFKYELMWGRDPKCFWVVKNAWKDRLHHNPMLNFYRKLKKTRDQLSIWNKVHFKMLGHQWFLDDCNRPPNICFEDILIAALCVVEAVWRERNSIVHGQPQSQISQLISRVNCKIQEHKYVASNVVEDFCAWSPPPASWLCCNCDIAADGDCLFAATIVRNDQGTIVAIKSEKRHITNPLIGEAYAVCMAAELMVEKKIEHVVFQCDNINVVNAFSMETERGINFNLVHLRRRFHNFCRNFKNWEIGHVSRKCNFMAHNIAKWARQFRVTGLIRSTELDNSVLNDYVEWKKHAG